MRQRDKRRRTREHEARKRRAPRAQSHESGRQVSQKVVQEARDESQHRARPKPAPPAAPRPSAGTCSAVDRGFGGGRGRHAGLSGRGASSGGKPRLRAETRGKLSRVGGGRTSVQTNPSEPVRERLALAENVSGRRRARGVGVGWAGAEGETRH